MKKNTFINTLSLTVGIICFIFMSLPILKDIMTNKKKKYFKKNEWVESPMTINEFSNKLNDNIYCKEYPDNIFSSLRFTYFLRTKYKLHLNCSITNLFRLYASYHKIKVANKIMPEFYVKALMDVDIDKKTNIFKFKETIYA